MSRNNLRKIIDAAVCLLLLLTSGWMVVRENIDNELLWPGLAVILIFSFYYNGLRISRRSVMVWLFFAALVLVHTIVYWQVDIKASLGFMAMLTCAVLAANSCRNFQHVYVDVVVAIAVVSLVFFVAQQLGVIKPGMFSFLPGATLEDGSVGAWIYTFHRLHVTRNCGPFWEPAVFAGYIIIALVLEALRAGSKSRWKALILVVTLLTTQSTTGYLALVPVACLWLLKSSSTVNIPVRIASIGTGIVVLAMVGAIAVLEVPMLGEKIGQQFEEVNRQEARFEKTRFGSAVYDWKFIKQRPLIGWTPSEKGRQMVDPSFLETHAGAGNGFTGFAANFGVVALCFYLWSVYRSARIAGAVNTEAVLILITVVVLLQGEQFLDFPLFWLLAFLPMDRDYAESPESSVES